MRIDFTYGHGSGNAFPIVDARALALADAEWATIARALADRRGPVGSDGLLALTAGDRACAFGFRMWNSDGSEAETCLNGLRLVARMGFAALGLDRATVHLATSTAEVARDADLAPGVYTVRETAGPADLDVARWPLTGVGLGVAGPGIAGPGIVAHEIVGHEIVERAIDRLPGGFAFTAVAMPNPHLIAFVDQVDEAALVRLGEVCEAAPAWLPNRANVSMVERRGEAALYVRTFERGVGLTDSCGSAMAAATFAAALTGRIAFGAETTIHNKGGRLHARAESNGMLTLSGNATFEWEGSAEIDPATGAVGAVTVTRRFGEEIAAWAGVVGGSGGGGDAAT